MRDTASIRIHYSHYGKPIWLPIHAIRRGPLILHTGLMEYIISHEATGMRACSIHCDYPATAGRLFRELAALPEWAGVHPPSYFYWKDCDSPKAVKPKGWTALRNAIRPIREKYAHVWNT